MVNVLLTTLELRSSPGSRFALAISPPSPKLRPSYAPPNVTARGTLLVYKKCRQRCSSNSQLDPCSRLDGAYDRRKRIANCKASCGKKKVRNHVDKGYTTVVSVCSRPNYESRLCFRRFRDYCLFSVRDRE